MASADDDGADADADAGAGAVSCTIIYVPFSKGIDCGVLVEATSYRAV